MSKLQNRLPETWKYWVVLNANLKGQKIYQIDEIFEITTVEDFFIKTALLPKVSEYKNVNGKKVFLALFRNQIQPAWEDEANENGATFTFAIQQRDIDEFFKTLCLAIVGGQMQKELFDNKPEICGIMVGARQPGIYGIDIWTKGDADITDLLQEFLISKIAASDRVIISKKGFHTHQSKVEAVQ